MTMLVIGRKHINTDHVAYIEFARNACGFTGGPDVGALVYFVNGREPLYLDHDEADHLRNMLDATLPQQA